MTNFDYTDDELLGALEAGKPLTTKEIAQALARYMTRREKRTLPFDCFYGRDFSKALNRLADEKRLVKLQEGAYHQPAMWRLP